MGRRRAASAVVAAALALAAAAAAEDAAAPREIGTPIITALDVGGVETRSAALMLSGQEAGDLAVSLLPLPLPGDGPRTRVLLVLDIDGASLLAGAEGEQLVTEVYAYALGSGGPDAAAGRDLADSLTRAFVLDLAQLADVLADGGVKFFGHLQLEPGDYSLRLLVRHRQAERFALRVVPMTVPEASAAALVPFSPEPAERWIVVREAGLSRPGLSRPGLSRPTGALSFPATIDGRAWVPATRPRLDGPSGVDLFVLGRGLAPPLRAHAGSGGELMELGLGDVRTVAGPDGMQALAARLSPSGLPPGRHALRLHSQSAPEATLPLVVAAPEATGADAEAQGESAAIRAQPGARPGNSRRTRPAAPSRSRHRAQVRSAYETALAQLAAHDREAARRALSELDPVLVSARDLNRLAQAQLEVALELAGGQVEVMVPMIWLHEQLYVQYYRQRRYLLATHSRRMLLSLADTYLERSRSPEARHLVASALASLGGHLQKFNTLPVAEDLYRRALELDPEHEAPLIGLATIREPYGDHDSAAELLERFLAARPNDPQARLRLAINLRRLGKTERALALLRESVSVPETDWITALAYQELANLHLAGERHGEARAVLEEGLTRHPEVQRLYLQLAALLDRMALAGEAREVLARLDPRAGSSEESPRLRYCNTPTAPFARARRSLAEAALRRLPETDDGLSSALPPPTDPGGPGGSG